MHAMDTSCVQLGLKGAQVDLIAGTSHRGLQTVALSKVGEVEINATAMLTLQLMVTIGKGKITITIRTRIRHKF